MATSPTTVTVNLPVVPGSILPVVHVSQYDVGSRTLKFNLVSYTIPDGATVAIRGTKPDKTGFSYACTVADGGASVVVQDQMTVCAGRVRCELAISQGGTILHTARFVLDVDKAPLDSATAISKTDMSTIEKATQDAAKSASAAAESADKAAKIAAGITPGSGASTAATITIGTVTTGDAGTSASVTNSGTTSAAVLDFVIPKGDKGDTGADGATGADGKTPAITATASVDDTTGTPAVKVTKSGTEVAPNFDFAFSGVKGTGGSSQVYETVAVTTTGWEDSTVNSTTYKKWTGALSKTYKPELTMCRLLPAGIVPTSDELTAYGLLVNATIDGTNLCLYGKAVPGVTYTVLISGVVK